MNDRKKKDNKHVQPGKAESFVDHALRLLEPKIEATSVRKKKVENGGLGLVQKESFVDQLLRVLDQA